MKRLHGAWSILLCVLAGWGCASKAPSRAGDVGIYMHEVNTSDERGARQAPEVFTLDACVKAALGAHPSLRAQHARWQAQTAHARAQSISWRDPVLSYTFAPLPIETRLGAQRHIVALDQPLSWPAELAQRAEVSATRADAASLAYDAAYLEIRREVSTRYWMVWELSQELEIVAQQQILLEGIEQGLRAQVELGRKPASELARAGVARVRLEERIRQLRAMERTSFVQLLAAMGIEQTSRVEPDTLESMPASNPDVDEVAQVLERGERPPHLEKLEHLTRSKQAQLELERIEDRPDIKVGAQWSIITARDQMTSPDAGRDAVMLRVGTNLPVWRGAQAVRIDAAEAAIIASQAEQELAELAWIEQLHTTHIAIEETSRQLEVIETTLMPMARTTFEMARGDYEAERADFGALLQSVDAVLDLEIQHIRLRARLARHLAMWQWLTAEPLIITQESAP